MADQVARVGANSWTVPSDADAIRLDAFLRHCLPHLSRSGLATAIDGKFFWIGGRPGRKGDRLKAEQTVTFRAPPEWLFTRPPPAKQLDIPILYEDACILVV